MKGVIFDEGTRMLLLTRVSKEEAGSSEDETDGVGTTEGRRYSRR